MSCMTEFCLQLAGDRQSGPIPARNINYSEREWLSAQPSALNSQVTQIYLKVYEVGRTNVKKIFGRRMTISREITTSEVV